MRETSGITEASYNWRDASPAVLDAMRFRCEQTQHDPRGAVSGFPFRVFTVCRWCGMEVSR